MILKFVVEQKYICNNDGIQRYLLTLALEMLAFIQL